MYHLEAVVVKWWSSKAESPPSTLHAPLATSKQNRWDRVVQVRGASKSGEKMWYYPALMIHWIAWIHIPDRAIETKSWERLSVYFHCMIRWRGNEMMSVNSGVCRIYTPHHSIHLRYPCISAHPPLHLQDALGGCDEASFQMHFEDVVVQTWRS